MKFWIFSSILLLIIVIISVVGPFLGVYGDVKKKTEKESMGG